MSSTQRADVKLNINGQQAVNTLDALQGKAKQLKQDLKIAFKAGDVKGYNKLKKDLSGIQKETRQIKRQMFDVDKVLRNLSGASIRDLQKAQAQLNRELSSGSVKRNSAQWGLLTNKLTRVNAEMRKVRASMMTTQSMTTRLANGFNKYFSMITAGVATLLGLVLAMRKAVTASNEFEASLANLSALTGLVGDDLDWLSKRALSLSASVTDAGVRISTSAKDILDAYIQMGSKKPELLANKEALAQVTEQAIILSEAAKMDLVPATNSLAVSMNQFNAPAKEAPRFINAIAAGSKVGAGNVLYIAEALENYGTAANGANLSIETSIGLVETLAPKFSKASKSGINLRNIITKLRAGADEFNPAIVGMEQSLNNLADANLSVNTLTEMFTIRNLNAIQVLIENRKEFVRYRDAVTDTNVAMEQAIINTSTNSAKLATAKTRLNKVSIELGKKLAPALTFSTNSVSYLIKGMLTLSKVFNENKILILTTTAAIVGWTIATKIQAKWTAIHSAYLATKAAITKAYALTIWTVTDATKMATFWQKAWNWAIKANPIGLLVTVLAAAATAVYLYSTRTEEARIVQEKLNEAAKEGLKIWENTKPIEERAKVLDNMNKNQLQSFKDDAAAQLLRIDRLNELKLLAEKKYSDDNLKLKDVLSNKYTYSELLSQQNQVKKSKEHLDHISSLVKKSNAEQLQSYINKADILLKLDYTTKEFTSIKDLKEEIARLTEAKDLLNITDKDAIAQAQAIIDVKKAELKIYEDLGTAADSQATLEDFIAKNAEEFEAWKQARDEFLRDQALYEKETKDAYDAAMSEEFVMEDEDSIEDDPAIIKAGNLARAEVEIYQESYQGRLDALDDALATGKITEEEYQKYVYELNQEYSAKKLKNVHAYLGAASALLNAYSEFQTAKMNEELKLAGDNEAEQERIRIKYAKRDQVIQSGQALIKGAMAVMNVWGNNTLPYPAALPFNLIMTGVIAAQTMAQVAVINSPQFAEGRIPVTGQDDGELYFAEQIDTPKTGVQHGPALISDLGDEMIIDGATTKELVINYPEIINGIKQMSLGGVPQFAEGKIPTSAEFYQTTSTDPAMLQLMAEIRNYIKEPSTAMLVTNEDYLRTHKQKMDEYNEFQNKVS